MLRIDAHHHLWRYDAEDLAWLNDGMAALRRDFLVEEFEGVLVRAGVHGAVAVQARESVLETRFLLDCARQSALIRAVVGWVPLQSIALRMVLDEFANEPKLVGVRAILQGKRKDFLDDEAFDRGIGEITGRNLTYDVLISENQLDEATRLVRRHPKQRFVMDHAAKPKIAARELEPWREKIIELARCENTWCKISGLVTEADWQVWTLDDLRPYLDVCVEVFGTQRLMIGSDWPVCLVATEYSRWWRVMDEYFAEFSEDERRDVFGGSALKFYGIEGMQA